MEGSTAGAAASRCIRAGLLWLYRRQHWAAENAGPIPAKAVIIAAPHTSNWDFLYFLGLTDALGIRPHFMAKQELFRWPIGGFLKDMGGVPIDRSRRGGHVQAMIEEFRARDNFLLTIAPEGTRGQVRHWRTGFYQIALGAGVPLIIGLMDYRRKLGGLGPAFMPSGDYVADMTRIEGWYRSVTPRHPLRAMTGIVDMARQFPPGAEEELAA